MKKNNIEVESIVFDEHLSYDDALKKIPEGWNIMSLSKFVELYDKDNRLFDRCFKGHHLFLEKHVLFRTVLLGSGFVLGFFFLCYGSPLYCLGCARGVLVWK